MGKKVCVCFCVVVFFSFVFHFIQLVGFVQNTNRQYQIENAHTATQWPNRTEANLFVSLTMCFFFFLLNFCLSIGLCVFRSRVN